MSSTHATVADSLAALDRAWLDLAAAHTNVIDAQQGLTGPRAVRAAQLASQIGDDLAFCRRLAMVVAGDMLADIAQ
jgi:hypothetical protein